MTRANAKLLDLGTPDNELTRIYRRICWLKAGGRVDEAEEIQSGTYQVALSAARAVAGSQVGSFEAILKVMESEEESRVNEAVSFSECMGPLVAEHLNLYMLPKPPMGDDAMAHFIAAVREQDRSERKAS